MDTGGVRVLANYFLCGWRREDIEGADSWGEKGYEVEGEHLLEG